MVFLSSFFKDGVNFGQTPNFDSSRLDEYGTFSSTRNKKIRSLNFPRKIKR